MERRGQNTEKKRRGKKIHVRPGAQLEVPEDVLPTTSCIKAKTTRARFEDSMCSDEDEDKCAGCMVNFIGYCGSEWVQCVACNKLYCGECNDETDDPYFTCMKC